MEKEIDKIENSSSEQINMNLKKKLESQLNEMYNEIAKGAQIRSKSKWIEEGEKNTKCFLGLEKKQQTNNTIFEIKTNGKTSSYNSEILQEMCNFYENLYTSKSTNDEKNANYIEKVDCPKLNTQDKEFCDKLPTLDECKDAVLNMKNNKSPGLDGLPSEFYKCFWNLIGPLFYEVLLTVFDNKELSFSQRLSLITVLFKKGDKNN